MKPTSYCMIQNASEDSSPKLVELLLDKFSIKILQSISTSPKSINMIKDDTKIPMTTLWRRIRFLKRNKIIKQTGGFGPSSRRYYFYQNSISSINFIFGQSLTVRLVRKISNPII
jgi:DNA-binding HxlR family transcriptional regulator